MVSVALPPTCGGAALAGPRLAKQLARLDDAYAVVRHIIRVSAGQLRSDVLDALQVAATVDPSALSDDSVVPSVPDGDDEYSVSSGDASESAIRGSTSKDLAHGKAVLARALAEPVQQNSP